jgi:hypothetical protein
LVTRKACSHHITLAQHCCLQQAIQQHWLCIKSSHDTGMRPYLSTARQRCAREGLLHRHALYPSSRQLHAGVLPAISRTTFGNHTTLHTRHGLMQLALLYSELTPPTYQQQLTTGSYLSTARQR